MLSYILQVTLCWGLFALLYQLLLRQETFFRANRYYLLGAVALGLLLPIVNQLFPVLHTASKGLSVTLPTLTVGLQQVEHSAVQWIGSNYLWWVYLTGMILAASRLIWGLGRLGFLAFQNQGERMPDGCLLIRTPEARLPFSFFHWIFVPLDFDSNEESRNMLAHERAHAHGRHSVDVLLMEMLCVVAWFHPLAHGYRRALRTVHEYLADTEAASQTDRRQYGLLLLQQAQPALALSFANHYFQSPLKQRLLMLTKNSSASRRKWKYCLVLPLALVLWTCTQAERNDQLAGSEPEPPLQLFEVEKIPEYPGGKKALSAYLGTNIQYPEAAKRDGLEGFAVLQITIDKNGRISHIAPIPAVNEKNSKANQRQDMVDEATRVVQGMPDWAPAYKNGKAVSCKLTLPIKFKLE